MRSALKVAVSCLSLILNARLDAQRVDSTATIVGRVVSSEGSRLDNARVVVGARWTEPDSSGVFRIDRLPAGQVRVRVISIGYERRDTTLTLVDGRTVRWDVRLTEGGFLRMAREEAIAQRMADSVNAINGGIDSAMAGLISKRAAGEPAYERFGALLLQHVARQRGLDSNTFISPLSAGVALAVAASGARGTTYQSMARLLGAEALGADALASRDSALLGVLSKRSDVALDIANALWISPHYAIRPTFVAKTEQAYGARTSRLDLSTDSSVKVVNAWVSEKTHGVIRSILNQPLRKSTALFITNVVYFRGLWLTPFDSSRTRSLAFHSQPGSVDSVPGMERTAHLGYYRGDRVQIVRLPYRSGRTALYIVLPDSGTTIERAETQLVLGVLPRGVSDLQSRDVHLRMPRVHAEATMDFIPSLRALGDGLPFECEHADFSLMLQFEGQRACIERVTQRTYLDIDEKGAIAVAVTGASIGTTSVPPPPIEFIVDRPFLIILRDEVSGVPLFMGRIVRPGTSLWKK